MSKFVSLLFVIGFSTAAFAQNCAPASDQRLIIYRAGSLTRAFKPMITAFTCQTGIQVKDVAMGSVDAGRQITAGAQACDLYAPADYLDIDLFMKPAGYADFDIVFARGRMVLAYSASGLAAKKLPPIAEAVAGSSVPRATAKWYQVLTLPGVVISGGHPFLDPGAYRGPMIFQLMEDFYHVPNLYNTLLEHSMVPGPDAGAILGKQFDFQFTYEHSAQATAASNPDYRYVSLPDEISMADPAKEAYYRDHAIVVLPGLGTSKSARTIAVPGAHVAWGITIMKDAPNKENAVKFLQLLLSAAGTKLLADNGPVPVSPALVSAGDFAKLPERLQTLVKKAK